MKPPPPLNSSPEEQATWLDEQLLTHPLGRVVGRLGWTIRLYFDDATNIEKRRALLEIARRFRDWVGEDKLGWWGSEATGKMHLLRKKKMSLDEIWKKCEKQDTKKFPFALAMTSIDVGDLGDTDNERTLTSIGNNAQQFMFECYASNRGSKFGYVDMHFPSHWAITRPAERSLAAWFRSCANILRPVHGYLGPGVLLPIEPIPRSNHEFAVPVWQLVKKFPGYSAERQNFDGHEGMFSIQWLTLINDNWLDKIGGREKVKAQCFDPLGYYEWDQGLIIQAGNEPERGDTEKPIDLPHYRSVAQMLRPLRRTDNYINIWMYGPGNEFPGLKNRLKDAQQLERDSVWYLARFD